MTYRIYTEKKNGGKVAALISKAFPAFTIFTALGVWMGKGEASMIIEIIAEEKDCTKITKLAKSIMEMNAQEAVLVTSTDTSERLYFSKGGGK